MEILQTLFLFVILAIVVEHIVKVLKKVFPPKLGVVETPVILSILVGVGVAVLTSTDLLSMLGFSVSVPWAAWVLTGVGLGGGASMAHELIAKLRASRDDIQ